MDFSKFHVVTVVHNPVRYQSRYRLYEKFRENIERKGAKLWTVELQTGSRYAKVTDQKHERQFQLWTTALEGIVWSKEMLQNYAVRQLTAHNPDWRFICFSDADVIYSRDWLEKTAHALQIHPVVQPWSHAIDYAPDGGAITDKMQISFACAHFKQLDIKGSSSYTHGGHPGYSLAMRREAYNDLGGLCDVAALGSGDRHMLCAIIGKVEQSYHPGVSPGYKRWLKQWQDRCDRYIKRNLGYVPEVIKHMFHGAKRNRQYGSRWQILKKWQFDPYTDLKLETNGLWTFVCENERQMGFRDATYRYYWSREEDSNSL